MTARGHMWPSTVSTCRAPPQKQRHGHGHGPELLAYSSDVMTQLLPGPGVLVGSLARPAPPARSPRIATLAEVGRPPGPRIASRAAKPVWMTRCPGSGAVPGRSRGSGSASAGSGARASAPPSP